jgi:isochorismate synthase
MSSPKVWWSPPGAEEVYTMEASDSGTSCFRFVPFKLNGDFPSIEWRGHVVGSDFPKSGTVSAEGVFEEASTSRDEHKRAVEGALQQIESKKLEKVVVSRVKSVAIEGSPEEAFKLKCKAHPDAFVYLLEHPSCGVWCGATPELLVAASDNRVETVSLAGTRTLDSIQDSPWSSKEHDEQELVTDYIKDILIKHGATDLRIEPREDLQYGNLVHLETRFRCSMKGNIADLATELHPTPAVGGRPLKEACEFIMHNEGFSREYFAGYLGVESASGSAYYVNLRCCKWMDSGVHLFAGGGIVEGSDIAEEWEETEAKIRAIQATLK